MDGFLPRKGVTLCSTGNEFEPLRRCLAPEVVSRRDRTRPQNKRNTDEVGVNLNAALACSPDNRTGWFIKACAMAKNGRALPSELFNIISNKKFVAGLPTRIGKTLCTLAHENSSLFSEGQIRYMQSNEWLLNAKYGSNEDEKSQEEGQDEEEEGSPAKSDEEQRPVFRTRHPDGDEEVARRLELERKLDAQEKERRWKREMKKSSDAVQEVDFTVRLMSKQPEKTMQELEQEADSSLQVLEQLNQRQHTQERRRRRREEPEDDPRDAPDSVVRYRRRRDEPEESFGDAPDGGERRRRRREETIEHLDYPADAGERRRRRREEAEVLDAPPDGGERRRHRREEPMEFSADAPDGGERRRRRREETEEFRRDAADISDDGVIRRRRRRRRLGSQSPAAAPESAPLKRRRRQTRSQSTSVSVQAARISPSSSREPDRRRRDRASSRAVATYHDTAVRRYSEHRVADELARQQAEEVAAHREHVRKEAEELTRSKGMLTMHHVEALRDVYRQDRISRNRAKLMKLGLGHELGM